MTETMLQFLSYGFFGILHFSLQQAIMLKIIKAEFTYKRFILSMAFVLPVFWISNQFTVTITSLAMGIYIILIIISYSLIFRLGLNKGLLLAAGQILLAACVEHVVLITLSIFKVITLESTDIYSWEILLLIRIFVATFLLLLYLLLKRVKFTISSDLTRNKQILTLVYLVFLILFTLPNILFMVDNQHMSYAGIEIYNTLIFSTFFIYNAILVSSLIKISNISQQLETQQLYIETNETTLAFMHDFKHDQSNIMQGINGFVERNDLLGLKNYLKPLNTQFIHVVTTADANQQLKNVRMLHGIMLSKLSLAELNSIEFRLSIPCQVELRECSIVDFSRIIGILLDNALEAAIPSERKYVEMGLLRRNGCYHISIKNSCLEDVDINVILERGYTTKRNHTGRGLNSTLSIIKKYQKKDTVMNIDFKYSDKTFTVLFIVR